MRRCSWDGTVLMADKSEGDSALGRHCIWGASNASAAAFDTALAGLDMLASRKVVAVRSPDRGMGRRWKIRIYQFHRFSPQASRKPQNQLISWSIWLCGMQPGSLRRRSRESRALHERSASPFITGRPLGKTVAGFALAADVLSETVADL